jgi:hypothetical protein
MRYILLSVLLCVITNSFAQNYVLLKDGKKSYRIFPGEKFSYYLQNDHIRYHDVLQDVKDGVIVLQYSSITPEMVAAIDIRNLKSAAVTNFASYAGLLMIAGVGYMAIDQTNNLIMGGSMEYNSGVARTSIILVGIGGAAALYKALEKKKVEINKTGRIILFEMPEPQIEEPHITEAY